jgi:hypothetical protein
VQLKIIEPLTNLKAHGVSGADAFHLVIASLPGYGFSGKPTRPSCPSSTKSAPEPCLDMTHPPGVAG